MKISFLMFILCLLLSGALCRTEAFEGDAVDFAEAMSRLWGVAECRLNPDGSVTLVDARDGDGHGLMMSDGISLGVERCELTKGQTCQVTDGHHAFIKYTFIGLRDDKIGFDIVDRFTWHGEDVHLEEKEVWLAPYLLDE